MASPSSQGEGVSERSSSLSELVSNLSERASAAPRPAPAAVPSATVTKPLPRQASSVACPSSIYSLTLDEFQNALGEPGKNFGSMNMDEFLKNIWTAEESQAMAAAIGPVSDEAPCARHAGIQRQGSISLPRTLSRKTVEDVWKDIVGANIDTDLGTSDPTSVASAGQERQVTFAEMTLEDFLVKAGVVQKENGSVGQSLGSFGISFDKASFDSAFGSFLGDDIAERLGHGNAFFGSKGVEDEKPNVKALPTLSLSTADNFKSSQAGVDSVHMDARHMSPQPRLPDWISNNAFQNVATHMQTHPAYSNLPQHGMEPNVAKGTLGNGVLTVKELGMGVGASGLASCMNPLGPKAGSPPSPLSDGIGPSHGSMSCLSPLPYLMDGVTVGRKRGYEGGLEKVVERRQRRMIKNRESAARSRARKQVGVVVSWRPCLDPMAALQELERLMGTRTQCTTRGFVGRGV